MPLSKFSSYKAEASIQKAIQDVDLGVKPSIRKAFDVCVLPPSTIAHRVARRLP